MPPRVRRLRQWLRPPRRLRLRRPGGFLLVGSVAVGLASLNTGNNLLYLLLGALLGTVALSGWLSEQVVRHVSVQRRVPRAVAAGGSARIEYRVHHAGRRFASFALSVREQAQPGDALHFGDAYVAHLEPGSHAAAHALLAARRRGVYPLQGVVLSTAFPFGLFDKERDLNLPGTCIVWPRSDRPVRAPRVGGGGEAQRRAGAGAAAGAERGDYRGLREYRPGDDPRDIHWRSTARRGEPILRQFDRDAGLAYWIVLDTAAPTAALAEAAVELAASLFAAGLRRGDRVGLAAGPVRLPPGAPGTTLEGGLDALAAVVMESGGGGALTAPADPASCVLVTARGAAGAWGDVVEAAVPAGPVPA